MTTTWPIREENNNEKQKLLNVNLPIDSQQQMSINNGSTDIDITKDIMEKQPLFNNDNNNTKSSFNNKYLFIFLSLYCFFRMLLPQQPFLVEFLTKDKHISLNTILFEIFPIYTYLTPFVQLTISFLSELNHHKLFFLGHRSILTLGILANLTGMLLEFFSTRESIFLLKLSEFTTAILYATDQTFYAFLYHIGNTKEYQWMTSVSRSSMLFGLVLAGFIGQIIYLFSISIKVLYFIGFVSVLPCLLICIFIFPSPKQYKKKINNLNNYNNSLNGNNNINSNNNSLNSNNINNNDKVMYSPSVDIAVIKIEENNNFKLFNLFNNCKKFIVNYILDIYHCYTKDFNVIFWSIFSILSVSIHLLALTFYQTFFKLLSLHASFLNVTIQNNNNNHHNSISLNGFFISFAYLSASLIILIPTKLKKSFLDKIYGKVMCIILTILAGTCFIILTINGSNFPIFLGYLLFIIYHCIFEFCYVVSYSQIAKGLKVNRFASIFGVNTALSNGCQVLIQFLFQVFALSPLDQFRVFGFILYGLSFLLILLLIINTIYSKCCK
ncbi:hypothetical protein ABK040_011101 [Willaertia magna]